MNQSRTRNQSLQARSRETRERLLTAGLRLFAEHGVERTNVDDICAATGIAKGTFYFHFPTKESLLVTAFHRGGAAIVAHADRLVAADTPFEKSVLALGKHIARNTASYPKPLVGHATVAALAAIDTDAPPEGGHLRRQAFLVLIRAGVERGETTTRYQPAELAMTLNWAIVQAMLTWSALPDRRPTLPTVVERRLSLALHGMTPKGK